MIEQTQTTPTQEIDKSSRSNARALELISSLSEEPDALRLSVVDIGDEQCIVAQVCDLTPEMKATFEGAGESEDDQLSRNWREFERDVESLTGADNIEMQAVRTGKTGRQKEIQFALFGLHNANELMESVHELNYLRKQDGLEPQEGLPDNIAYLPDNLLVATKELRSNSEAEFRALVATRDAAISAGAAAVSEVASKTLVTK